MGAPSPSGSSLSRPFFCRFPRLRLFSQSCFIICLCVGLSPSFIFYFYFFSFLFSFSFGLARQLRNEYFPPAHCQIFRTPAQKNITHYLAFFFCSFLLTRRKAHTRKKHARLPYPPPVSISPQVLCRSKRPSSSRPFPASGLPRGRHARRSRGRHARQSRVRCVCFILYMSVILSSFFLSFLFSLFCSYFSFDQSSNDSSGMWIDVFCRCTFKTRKWRRGCGPSWSWKATTGKPTCPLTAPHSTSNICR